MSEFGRGYATCLREFTFHSARLDEQLALYARMSRKEPRLFIEGGAVELWANGASDHLAELKRPRRGVPMVEWRLAKRLADRALDIGHGFRSSSRSTEAEVRTLLSDAERLLDCLATRGHAVATLEDAMETDRALGLLPDAGEWSCREDLRNDKVESEPTA
jgi:hypothetical protein